MKARLVISELAYALAVEDAAGWTELAVLPGAGNALLPPNRAVDQTTLEGAIERAEDWLMPHAARLTGAQMDVVDLTGQLAPGLQEIFSTQARQWDTAQVEALFEQLDFMTARPRMAAGLNERRSLVAAIVLLRELAHHGKLEAVRLAG